MSVYCFCHLPVRNTKNSSKPSVVRLGWSIELDNKGSKYKYSDFGAFFLGTWHFLRILIGLVFACHEAYDAFMMLPDTVNRGQLCLSV